jgi:signal peptidase I
MSENVELQEQNNEPEQGSMMSELYDWVQCIVSAVLCCILIFVFCGRLISVDGSSMYPTLHNGDRVITSNLLYTPKYGDIIILSSDSFEESFGSGALVKRIIATEGQTVDIDFEAGIVYVDGAALDEPYVNELTYTKESVDFPVTVPEGCVFVMGDNRNASTDSRDLRVGMVDTRNIIGKVYLVAIPGSNEYDPRDWSRLGLVK